MDDQVESSLQQIRCHWPQKTVGGALAIAVIAGAEGGRDVFVLLGEVAVRRRIQIGLSGFDYCQVLAGLEEGEEVIISDTAEYLTLPLVAVR